MVNPTDLPTAVYLNEPAINSTVQYLDGGEVEHLIEEYSSSDETTTGGGLDISEVLEFYREKTSGNMEKTAKKIQRNPIGNFAVYHAMLKNDDSLTDLTGVDRPFRDSLDDRGYIKVRGKIRRSPFGMLLEMGDFLSRFADIDMSSDSAAYQQMKTAAEYFEMPMKNLKGSFVYTKRRVFSEC